jgi:hypothetical protein
MALATPPALQGMLRGTVPADWATEHHAKWRPEPPASRAPVGITRIALAIVVAGAGLAGALLLAR